MRSVHGFAALIAVLVLASVLTTLAFSVAQSGLYTRLAALDAEYGAEASVGAEACIRIALLRFVEDPSYQPNSAPIALDTDRRCAIERVVRTDTVLTIITNARSGTSVARLQAEASLASSSPLLMQVHELTY